MCEKKELINLYLEQIKYLRQENVSIQDKFIATSGLSLSLLGVIVYYIESSLTRGHDITYFYLFLPFLFFWLPYNIIKYSIRMLGINAYLEYLEKKINLLVGEETFLWNSKLIDSGFFGGFAISTTAAQIPINLACALFLAKKYIDVQSAHIYFAEYYLPLNILIILLLLFILIMIINLLCTNEIILEKLDSNNKIKLKKSFVILSKNIFMMLRAIKKADMNRYQKTGIYATFACDFQAAD